MNLWKDVEGSGHGIIQFDVRFRHLLDGTNENPPAPARNHRIQLIFGPKFESGC